MSTIKRSILSVTLTFLLTACAASRPIEVSEPAIPYDAEAVAAERARDDAHQKSVETAKSDLTSKIHTLAVRYAAGPESAESIGHAVASACEAEIGALVGLEAESLRQRLSDPDGLDARLQSNKWRLEATEKMRARVWRIAVADVVEIRSPAENP